MPPCPKYCAPTTPPAASSHASARNQRISATLSRLPLRGTAKKYDLQVRQLKDTENREKYKVYGELINTYGYNVEEGAKKLDALNYYTNEMISIPLDPAKTPQENAQRYFAKYNKQKRTFEALSELSRETKG